jgi:monofunctional biosynthetic peptidoglycan transglycosylase
MLRERWLHARPRPIQQHWVPWSGISPHLAIAVVAAEDQTFPLHHGFDLESISKALRERRARQRGASTISQQLAKNLFLWPGRSFVRKGLEAWLTLLIESLWPKRRILEVYLNLVEFGPGIFGAGAASQQLFDKSPRALTPRDAALLAAVLPNPKRMSAARPSRYVHERAAAIERAVARLGGAGYLAGL